MRINFKFVLLSVMLCFSINMQASSLTTALQCAVPIVTGYKSYQDLQDSFNFIYKLENQGEPNKVAVFKKESQGVLLSSLLISTVSIVAVGVDIVIEHDSITLGLATVCSGAALVSCMHSHKTLEHAKNVVHVMPSIFDQEFKNKNKGF